MFSDAELERYSRQILLSSIDVDGQLKLKKSRVAIVGVGGLGSTVAMMLAGSGVGHIRVVDYDLVELSNLQRQVLFRETDIGKNKALAAHWHLSRLNCHIDLTAETTRIRDHNIESILHNIDLVLDCTDNFETRQLINKHCVEHKINLIQGSALQLQGELISLPVSNDDCGCYECLYSELENARQPTCSEAGVLAPLLSIVGGLQAQLAIQLMILGRPNQSMVYRYDSQQVQFKKLTLKKQPDCKVCGQSSKQDQCCGSIA